MRTAAHIIETVGKLVKKYDTRDPYELCKCLEIKIHFQLYVPAALLDYKFSLLHEKGELVSPMYIRKTKFLKDDLGDYFNGEIYYLCARNICLFDFSTIPFIAY